MEYATLDTTPRPTTLLLKGPPGSGKTYKAAHFPRPVLFNFDNNLAGLRKVKPEVSKGVRLVHPRLGPNKKALPGPQVWSNFIKALEEVGKDPSVGTIVIDSLTTLAEVLLDKILGSDDPARRPEIQHWGDFTRYLKWVGDELLCANDLDKNVVIIAHEQLEVEEITKRTTYSLNLQTNMRYSFDLFFTDVWRTYVKQTPSNKLEPVQYWVRTLPTEYHTAKCTLNVPPDFKWDDQQDSIVKQLNENLPYSEVKA